MKCGNSAFNAQGSRVIVVSCTGRSSEIPCSSSSSGGAQEKKKERQDKTHFTTKNCWKN
jgi:hypothetical protein